MSDRQKNLNLPNSLENFARGLLSTTCLTVVCGSGAVAGTVNLPNSDFPNSSPGVLLPVGTTVVNGFAGALPDEGGVISPDWFEFQGLISGDTYHLSAVGAESALTLSVFTSSLTPLFLNQSMEGAGAHVSGPVPSNGLLEVEIVSTTFPAEGESSFNFAGTAYQVTLSEEAGSSSAPEPGTLVPVGLALAGALAWSRKRRQ